MSTKTILLTITGLVQGVGFRPFIYRTATGLDLKGWVQNTNENVRILLTGEVELLALFQRTIRSEAPPAALIESIESVETEPDHCPSFTILESQNESEKITEISPDIAVCPDCLEDMKHPGNRLDYSFVNCTNCGPRFTIIRDLPYDRAKTTMHPFPMCPKCREEYGDILDRRFHAQPTACNDCGPHYELYTNNLLISREIDFIANQTALLIDEGGIIAVKGMGGMHLACDAFNPMSVDRLRQIKNREAKPFAVLFRDLETARKYAHISKEEEESLTSWRRPIVLLSTKKTLTRVNAGLNLLGVMNPYLPLHYQLFQKLKTEAIVLTSGNFSSEPIVIDNAEALRQFGPVADAVLLHNRDIYNRTDDSVVRIMGNRERVLRRSRGYVPAPVRLPFSTDGIIAFGAELTNCFAVGKGDKAYISQHIGDLKGLETAEFYVQTLQQFIQLFRIRPSLLAVDRHPDYISTRMAEKFGLPVTQVQHHHAHLASCMAENGLDERVIGVAFDGTGLGDDGNSWGSEFMVCDLTEYTRITHFDYMPLPGGDLASEEPWRMAVSWLYRIYGRDCLTMDLPVIRKIGTEKVELLLQMIERKINCPLTSGAGRLFDAVASLLDLCQVAAFSAQGPMLLEANIKPATSTDKKKTGLDRYQYTVGQTINFDDTIRGIVDDLGNGAELTNICRKFHNTIISAIFDTVQTIRRNEGIQKVVLSGGVFQNKYLLEGTESLLKENNFEVFTHSTVPSNDGGIALGQMAVAAKRREKGCV